MPTSIDISASLPPARSGWRASILASLRENCPIYLLIALYLIGADSLSAWVGTPHRSFDRIGPSYDGYVAVCTAMLVVRLHHLDRAPVAGAQDLDPDRRGLAPGRHRVLRQRAHPAGAADPRDLAGPGARLLAGEGADPGDPSVLARSVLPPARPHAAFRLRPVDAAAADPRLSGRHLGDRLPLRAVAVRDVFRDPAADHLDPRPPPARAVPDRERAGLDPARRHRRDVAQLGRALLLRAGGRHARSLRRADGRTCARACRAR